jgi:lipopolysaccharide biosynthesis glycosyltransferase
MLDYYYNNHEPQAAADTLKSINKHFTDMMPRSKTSFYIITADIDGRNKDAYNYYLKEYKEDSMDLFVNNSAIVLAQMYERNPRQALRYFTDIPFDSLHIDGCV